MNNMVVEGGSKTLDELRSMPHIEITDFSAFDMDAVSGTCGGEIRLAYESDGTTSHPTTSGSLSARYDDVLKNLTFSKETQQINNRVVKTQISFNIFCRFDIVIQHSLQCQNCQSKNKISKQ